MARNCNFDRQEKLIEAMELFWQQGYANTSIADLVAHLGINRFSLYNSYGDKQRLYREALDYYLEHVSFPPVEAILHPRAALGEVRDYISRFIALQRNQQYGCFLQNAVLEHGLTEPFVQQASARLFSRLEQAFARALTNAGQTGELKADVVPEKVSRFLLLQLQGIRVLGKAGQYQVLSDATEVLLDYLSTLKSKL
ncbi:TetR/AcrR family transcriptional regulator [Zobellella maritima]|uniref:TetR/AcrR family transcriptional regulator n=1 Tax=Zobellella maritima TaxID=2059725 RepID=UPI000E309737|nr:TetR/AcrR family transcriptional regulator [Zobellella maritima]